MPALTGRWDAVSVVSDEPGVMEELSAGEVSMLVVVEPDRWASLKPLALAVGQYFGHVLCMQFVESPAEDQPRVTPLASRWLAAEGSIGEDSGALLDASADGHATADDGSQEDADAAKRRRNVSHLVVHVAEEPGERSPEVPTSLVTEEELSMLLGPLPGEAC